MIGLAVVVAAFVGCMGLSWWAKDASRGEMPEPPAPPTTEGLVGFPEKLDPVVTLSRARELTDRQLLRGFAADGVRSDGTIDFSKKGARLRYSFQSAPGEGLQPQREPGTIPTQTYCGKQSVWVKKEGITVSPDVPNFPCSPRKEEPLPEPRCTLADVWKRARAKGAPGDRVARIEYYRAKGGPAYRFSVPATRHKLVLYGDCERELKGKQAMGHVP